MKKGLILILMSTVIMLSAFSAFDPVEAHTYISVVVGEETTFKTDFGFSSTKVDFTNPDSPTGKTGFENNKVPMHGDVSDDGTVSIAADNIYLYWDLYTSFPLVLSLYESGPLGESSWQVNVVDDGKVITDYGIQNAIVIMEHAGSSLRGYGCREISVTADLWDSNVTYISSGTLQSSLVLRLETK